MLLIEFCWGYLGLFWLFHILKLIAKGRFWWIDLINSFTLYWFVPIIFIFLIASIIRDFALLILSVVSASVFLYHFGYLFIPKPIFREKSKRSLSVMTYNVLESNTNVDGILYSIISENPDVVAFQEITNIIANKISEVLSPIFPFQEFGFNIQDSPNPRNAFVSKYPFKLVNSTVEGCWKTPPQVMNIDFNDSPIYFINIHAHPTRIGTLDTNEISQAFIIRQQQIESIVRYVNEIELPLIIAGDLNTTEQNYAYSIITNQLQDAWRSAGWGFGHTFGLRNNTFRDIRPLTISSYFPRWLLRIDFIFHSDNWTTTEARTGKWDKVSDHRPVVAIFVENS